MDTRLLNLLVCPICKGPLDHWRPPAQERQELVCHADRLAFLVRVFIRQSVNSLMEHEHYDSRRRRKRHRRKRRRLPHLYGGRGVHTGRACSFRVMCAKK
mgnify:CR=1 FL=1